MKRLCISAYEYKYAIKTENLQLRIKDTEFHKHRSESRNVLLHNSYNDVNVFISNILLSLSLSSLSLSLSLSQANKFLQIILISLT